MTKNLPAFTEAGGYSITYLTERNEVLCPACANTSDDVASSFVHWEGSELHCEGCNATIKSEYGDPGEDAE